MRPLLLTLRSHFSLLRAAVAPQALVEKAAQLGYGAVALADVNSLAGAVEFFKAARQAQVIPLLGVEIVTDTERLTLIARDETGYRNLCRIVSACHLQPDFDPVTHLQQAHRGLVCLCNQLCLLKRLSRIFRKGTLFTPPAVLAQSPSPRGLARVQPITWAITSRLEPADQQRIELLAKIRALGGQGAGPESGMGAVLEPASRWARGYGDTPEALENAESLVERCRFDLFNRGHWLPRAHVPAGRTSPQELARQCHLGLARRYGQLTQSMVRRLETELNTIREHGFCDYFLVVREIIDFAKGRGIPVEVRGSAAGSLVSYVLGFTRVCPLKNGLYFERFMNPGRTDCPDIDVDLCWRRREEVIRFCYDRWGHDHVAMVCNINRFRRRGAMRDVARALGYSSSEVDEIAARPKRHPNIRQQAESLVGIPRHLGVHCGGIIITPEPLAEVAPLTWATKGVIITQYDKRAAEPAGLIKIDLLGNRALSTVHDAVQLVQARQPDFDIETAACADDEATARVLTAGDSLGVFQSESPAMRQMLRALRVKNEPEQAIALSLIRPGPAGGGMKAEFIQRHVFGKPFRYLHPALEPLLRETYGVMLYQEDVMRIAIELAGYTVAEADRFRSEVSKKVSATRVQAQYEDFVYRRSGEHDIDRDTAEQIWDQILQFAAYSFCKAHATVYAHIAWQTAFLKAHYPQAFYCSLFNNHHGMYPLRVYVWDAMRHGLRILPPHVNYSAIEWVPERKSIRAGLGLIKGLSHESLQAIRQERQVRAFRSLDDLRCRVHFRKGQLEGLIQVGGCDGLGPSRPAMLEQLHFAPVDPVQPLLFEIKPPRRPEYNRMQKVIAEVECTGIPFSFHPELLLKTQHTPAKWLGQYINQNVTVAGFVATARRARTQDGRIMGFLTLEDSTGLTEISFFPDQLEVYRTICTYGGPIWVRGRVTEHLSSITLEGSQGGRAA